MSEKVSTDEAQSATFSAVYSWASSFSPRKPPSIVRVCDEDGFTSLWDIAAGRSYFAEPSKPVVDCGIKLTQCSIVCKPLLNLFWAKR
eukprot:4874640-Ditylum_brightwellii.AAC.1